MQLSISQLLTFAFYFFKSQSIIPYSFLISGLSRLLWNNQKADRHAEDIPANDVESISCSGRHGFWSCPNVR